MTGRDTPVEQLHVVCAHAEMPLEPVHINAHEDPFLVFGLAFVTSYAVSSHLSLLLGCL